MTLQIFSYPWLVAIFLVFILLHIYSAAAGWNILSKCVNFLNIALHILFIIPLAILNFSTEEGALLYMISAFFYILPHGIKYFHSEKRRLRKEATREQESVDFGKEGEV